jgi:hypothetical protein
MPLRPTVIPQNFVFWSISENSLRYSSWQSLRLDSRIELEVVSIDDQLYGAKSDLENRPSAHIPTESSLFAQLGASTVSRGPNFFDAASASLRRTSL